MDPVELSILGAIAKLNQAQSQLNVVRTRLVRNEDDACGVTLLIADALTDLNHAEQLILRRRHP